MNSKNQLKTFQALYFNNNHRSMFSKNKNMCRFDQNTLKIVATTAIDANCFDLDE